MEEVSHDEALECIKKLIRYMGDDPDREGLQETPKRVLKSYEKIYNLFTYFLAFFILCNK